MKSDKSAPDAKLCAWPEPPCPALRAPNAYLCAGHLAVAKATKPKRRVKTNRVTLAFDRQCELAGLPIPIAEHRFHLTRKWRLDWAFLLAAHPLAVEVEGGVFLKDGGRHTRGAGFRKDTEKYAEALILGWRVLRVLPEQIDNGQALTWVSRILRP